MESSTHNTNSASNKEQDRIDCSTNVIKNICSNSVVIVAGPGTGKTYTFGEVLKKQKSSNNLVITFINDLVDDLRKDLESKADVCTFDSFVKKECERLGLFKSQKYFLNAAEIINEDYNNIFNKTIDVNSIFSNLTIKEEDDTVQKFIQNRCKFYNFVDPCILKYRLLNHYKDNPKEIPIFEIVIADEFQDFSKIESEIIMLLSSKNKMLIAGDDDQVVFSFKGSHPESLRELFNKNNDFKSCELPYCSRCPAEVVNFINDLIPSVNLNPSRCKKKYIPYNNLAENTQPLQYFEGNSQNILHKMEEILKDLPRSSSVLFLFPYTMGKKTTRIFKYLQKRGFDVEFNSRDKNKIQIFEALKLLEEDENSNLGWRLLIPSKKIVESYNKENNNLFDILTEDFKENILLAVKKIKNFNSLKSPSRVAMEDALLELLKMPSKEYEVKKPDDRKKKIQVLKIEYLKTNIRNKVSVKFLQISQSKGLSADYVFLYPFSTDGFDLNEENDICNLIVGVTRTKKGIYLFNDNPTKKLKINMSQYQQ